ncbi:Polyribonucleotide nucleotidyltransferase [Labeo rohita]|uniref:Polyribonucleotide nucleotidyltransferase n=1 Tax=Labeo rohita TaxID=84645 RepID=A0ABQ8L5T4_LABRO|nr:Polyribonucleotide nucleotidyltransferase [Labeo rohita]
MWMLSRTRSSQTLPAFYVTIVAAQGDPLIVAKLEFFLAISQTFRLLITKFQTDDPVLPFVAKDLKECMQGLATIVNKMQEKSPQKFSGVGHIACLGPTMMIRGPEWYITKTKSVVQRFLQDKQLAGGVSASNVFVQQFKRFLSVEGRGDAFLSFQPFEQPLNVFLHKALSTYPELLSHGQATVERGFSVNKEVKLCNLLEEYLEAQRLICDQVSVCGAFLKVALTK